MKKRDILGMIRMDLERKKKPKKSIDDFLLSDEDQHEEIINKKMNGGESRKKKKDDWESMQIGVSKQDEAIFKPKIRQLDWGELNKLSLREQNMVLKREYIAMLEKLEEVSIQAMQEKETVNEKMILIRKQQREIKEIKDAIRRIVEYIPDAYELKTQMDTSDWRPEEVVDEIVQKIKSVISKVKYVDKIIKEETEKVLTEKKYLEAEVIRLKEKIKKMENEATALRHRNEPVPGTSQTEIEQTLPAETEEKMGEIVPKPIPEFEADTKEEEKTEKFHDENVPKYVFLDVERYLEGFPEEAKFILKVIGETGVSRNAELRKEVEKREEGKRFFFKNGKFEYIYLRNAVKTLKERQFIDTKEVNLGARGYKFDVYELNDIGKAIYYKFEQKEPVESEMKKILSEHKSLEHGYLIREVADEFRAKNYTVYEDRESCTFKLPNNQRKVFDLVIEKDGAKKYIEVERGTHATDDFFKAMDKIAQITKEFYFVAPTDKIIYQVTKAKVFKWISDRLGGFQNAKGYKFCFTTLEKIKKSDNPWEEVNL